MGKAAIDFGKFWTFLLLSALPGGWAIGSVTNRLGGWIVGTLAALPVVAVGLLIACPAMLALRRAGRNSAFNYLLLGGAVGVLLEWMLAILAASTPHASPLPLGGAWGAALGLWSGAMWCLLFRARPRSFARASAPAR